MILGRWRLVRRTRLSYWSEIFIVFTNVISLSQAGLTCVNDSEAAQSQANMLLSCVTTTTMVTKKV